MDPLSVIATALGSANSAMSLAEKIAKKTKDPEMQRQLAELGSAILDLQNKLYAVRDERAALVREKEQIESEFLEFKKHVNDMAKYKLQEPHPGFFVYSEQANEKPSKEAPWLCAKCYNDGETSILQTQNKSEYNVTYYCDRCNKGRRIILKEKPPRPRRSGSWKTHI